MRVVRFAALVLYAGYLVHVGLLMLLLPWSEPWPMILTRVPLRFAVILDAPAVRGVISGFGLLHLLLVAAELVRTPIGDRAEPEPPPAAAV